MPAWSHSVTLNGSPVDIVGVILVRAEESTAASAQFEYSAPAASVFNPAALLGKTVVVQHSEGGGGLVTIFTGTVDTAVPKAESGLIAVTATDGLLAHFDALDEAGILAAIPAGKYHEAVFGLRTTGWAQAQSVLETVAGEVHMTPLGAIEFGSWVIGTSQTITNAVYLSEGAEFADARNQVNKVEVTIQYRFTRMKERRVSLNWTHPQFSSLPSWVAQKSTLPTRDMIQAAADGTGWQLRDGISYQILPDTIGGWSATADQRQKGDIVHANVDLFYRWTQPITETYQLDVKADATVTPVEYQAYVLETPFDPATWEGLRVSYDPGWLQDAIDDYYRDNVDRVYLGAMMECAIARAQRRLTWSRRQNYIQFAIPCDHSIGLNIGMALDTDWASAAGKIYGYEHRLDTAENGVDITVITIACSSTIPTAGSAVILPTAPVSGPTWAKGLIPGMADTHIGSIGSAPADDPDWIGYVGNYDPALGGTGDQIYDGRFRIGAPDIEQENLQPVEATAATKTYNAWTPGGTIQITPSP